MTRFPAPFHQLHVSARCTECAFPRFGPVTVSPSVLQLYFCTSYTLPRLYVCRHDIASRSDWHITLFVSNYLSVISLVLVKKKLRAIELHVSSFTISLTSGVDRTMWPVLIFHKTVFLICSGRCAAEKSWFLWISEITTTKVALVNVKNNRWSQASLWI